MFGLSKRTVLVLGLLIVVAVIFVVQGGKNGNASGSSSGQCQMQVTADVLNVRSSPDGRSRVVGKLNNGAVTPAQTAVQNGFRQLGDNRWVSAQFLKPISGSC